MKAILSVSLFLCLAATSLFAQLPDHVVNASGDEYATQPWVTNYVGSAGDANDSTTTNFVNAVTVQGNAVLTNAAVFETAGAATALSNAMDGVAFAGEVDPVFAAAPTSTWNTAYGWGDHGTNGYLTSVPAHDQDWSTITGTPTTVAGYGITDGATGTPVYVESDPVFAAAPTSTWDTAYAWGDHGTNGYLTTEVQTLQQVVNLGSGPVTNAPYLVQTNATDVTFAGWTFQSTPSSIVRAVDAGNIQDSAGVAAVTFSPAYRGLRNNLGDTVARFEGLDLYVGPTDGNDLAVYATLTNAADRIAAVETGKQSTNAALDAWSTLPPSAVTTSDLPAIAWGSLGGGLISGTGALAYASSIIWNPTYEVEHLTLAGSPTIAISNAVTAAVLNMMVYGTNTITFSGITFATSQWTQTGTNVLSFIRGKGASSWYAVGLGF